MAQHWVCIRASHRVWKYGKPVQYTGMYTVVETSTFQKQVEKIWSESERMDFIDWIAENPLSGDVIPGAQGARKVRWSVAGRGKRGGVRVIYFNLTNQGVLILLMVYTKSEQSNLEPGEIRNAI